MKHGIRRGVAAALGVVLVLGLSVGPAAADPEEPPPPPIGSQVKGLQCDRVHDARPTFYPGESASHVYDDRFSQVGEWYNRVPYLGKSDMEPGWIPQGLASWPNWDGKGNDLLLVSAYRGSAPSLIHGIDAATGEHVGSVTINETHAGGIVVFGDYAYVSAKGSRSVFRYRLTNLRDRLQEGGRPYLEPQGNPSKTPYGVAFLGTDGKTVYAGMYDKEAGLTAPAMASYTADSFGRLLMDGPAYFVPRGTQGMTIVDGDFYFSVSPTHVSEMPGRRSFIYRATPADMEASRSGWPPPPRPGWHFTASGCFRAPSMSEGMTTHGNKTYLVFESGAGQYRDDPDKPNSSENPPENEVKHIHVGQLGFNDPGDGQGNTSLSYTGPTSADFHDGFKPSVRLRGPSGPVSGAKVSFTLGRARSGDSCQATTDSSGVGTCSLTPSLVPGTYTLTMRFGGGGGLDPATETVTFTVTKQETALRYTGPKRVANGTPAKLSGRLTEEDTDGAPVSGRKVSLALGRGGDRQDCDATTGDDGKATCTIDKVDQPLNDDATVPVSLDFDGDAYYKPSKERATVLLEYYTGRSYGVSADVSVAGLGTGIEPTPDTGKVRTARASTHDPGCAASLGVLPLLRTGTLCPKVVTSLAPGTSRARSAVQEARIGLPGLPLIEVETATARSTSTCDAGGSSTGSTDLRLRVGGRLIDATGKVNAEIDLPGVARLVVNEQKPVPGAEHGRTVNAVHLTAAGAADVVIASATSDVHNCA